MQQSLSLPRQPSSGDPSTNSHVQPPLPGPSLALPTPPLPPYRRTSHPHNNNPWASPSPFSSIMADQRRSHPRPSFEHQTSRTVIDLTEDADPFDSQPRRSSQRPNAPPQLERSDRTSLGDIISIDSDDDIEIVSSRQLPGVRPRPQVPISRLQSDFGQRPNRSPRRPRADLRSLLRDPIEPRFEQPHSIMRNPNMFLGGLANLTPGDWRGISDDVAAYMFGARQQPPRMPGEMNYHQHAFARAEPRKEEHVPPPKAREGFTRSPKEDDVVVCPACDEELMVGPEEPVPAKKPGARQKSKKDREEHPFWVVRDCGHVSTMSSFFLCF